MYESPWFWLRTDKTRAAHQQVYISANSPIPINDYYWDNPRNGMVARLLLSNPRHLLSDIAPGLLLGDAAKCRIYEDPNGPLSSTLLHPSLKKGRFMLRLSLSSTTLQHDYSITLICGPWQRFLELPRRSIRLSLEIDPNNIWELT